MLKDKPVLLILNSPDIVSRTPASATPDPSSLPPPQTSVPESSMGGMGGGMGGLGTPGMPGMGVGANAPTVADYKELLQSLNLTPHIVVPPPLMQAQQLKIVAAGHPRDHHDGAGAVRGALGGCVACDGF